MEEEKEKRFVVVTDTHRTVWCGWTTEEGREETIRLTEGRHCRYFDTTEGIGELAEFGPGPKSHIGAVIPEMIVRNVSTVQTCSDQAIERFSAQGWGGPRE